MAEDIIPPLPPGQKDKKHSKHKKQKKVADKPEKKEKKRRGLFGFKKKNSKDSAPPPPASYSPDAPPSPEDSLNDTRKALGLPSDLSEGIPEPNKIKPEADIGEPFELPDIEDPPMPKPDAKPALQGNGLPPEPPKIETKEEPKPIEEKHIEVPKPVEEKHVEEPKPVEEKPVSVHDSLVDWKESIGTDTVSKEASEFTGNVKTDEDIAPHPASGELTKPVEPEPPGHGRDDEFVKDVEPDTVKELVQSLERKKFEDEKGIKYEPDVRQWIEEPEDPIVLEESPEEEMKDIKERLKLKLTDGLEPEKKEEEKHEDVAEPPKIETKEEPKPVEEKHEEVHHEQPPEPESPPAPEELLVPTPEHTPEQVLHEPPKIEEKKEEHEELPKVEAVDIARVKDEVTNEITERIRKEEIDRANKIIAEEKEKIEKKLAEEKENLEKQKQEVEQEKIGAAGRENKCEFREKNLIKDKEQFETEREDYLKDKDEAKELLEKLPGLKDDYTTLQNKMKEVYAEIKRKEDLLIELEDKQNSIKEAEKRLIYQEEKIRKDGFTEFVEDELRARPIAMPKAGETDILKASNLELYNLIDSCKSHIRQNNLEDAKNMYTSLRDAYNTMNVEGAEKDMLYTAVRELYDDIKLAEMESGTLGFRY